MSANTDARRRGNVVMQTPGYEDSDGNIQHIAPGDVSYDAGVDWDPSGGGEAVVHNFKQAGTSAWDKSVDRYRRMGADAQMRQGVQLDASQADASRGLQMDALSMLRRQADGSAPSSAAILSQRANQGAAMQVGAAGLRKGGPGAAIASMRAGGRSAGEAALGANAQNADARAGEVSRGQGAYSSGAMGIQGQDIQGATTNAQLTAQQRGLNEARQQRFERLGFDTRTTQLQAGVDTERARHLNQLSINQAQDARRDSDAAKVDSTRPASIASTTGTPRRQSRPLRQCRPPRPLILGPKLTSGR